MTHSLSDNLKSRDASASKNRALFLLLKILIVGLLNIWRRAPPQYEKLLNGCCKNERANAEIWENSFGNVERIPLYDFPSFNKQ